MTSDETGTRNTRPWGLYWMLGVVILVAGTTVGWLALDAFENPHLWFKIIGGLAAAIIVPLSVGYLFIAGIGRYIENAE